MKINSNNVAFGHNIVVGKVQRDDSQFYEKMTQQLEDAENLANKFEQTGKDIFVLKFHVTDKNGEVKPDCSAHILTDKHARPMTRLEYKIRALKARISPDEHSDVLAAHVNQQIEMIRQRQRDLAKLIVRKVKSADIDLKYILKA